MFVVVGLKHISIFYTKCYTESNLTWAYLLLMKIKSQLNKQYGAADYYISALLLFNKK